MLEKGESYENAQTRLDHRISEIEKRGGAAPELIEAKAELERLKNEGYTVRPNQGALYQVRIHANRDMLLDLDKPLTEQSPAVQEAIEPLLQDKINQAAIEGKFGESLTGQSFYEGLQFDTREEQSKALSEVGVPGLKYLDQESRDVADAERAVKVWQKAVDKYPNDPDALQALANAKARAEAAVTRNFVIFDHNDVEITHKNGLPVEPHSVNSANLSPDALPRTLYPAGMGNNQGPPLTPPGAPGAGAPPGGGPPPLAGINPPLTPAQPWRPPYFTYDDRGAVAKAFSRVIRTWQETFQPELVSDKALQADPFFAEYKAASQNKKDQIVINQEENYQYWRTQSEADQLRYLQQIETGNVERQWRDRADVHRAILEKAYDLEQQFGSKADYFENYFPHLFESPLQARNWIAGKSMQLGPTWFQKERTFATIREAMDAGLRLKSTNPEDLITGRLFSSADMLERMNLIGHLKNMGLAIPVEQARAERNQRFEIGAWRPQRPACPNRD
jgi:hypothetical protein